MMNSAPRDWLTLLDGWMGTDAYSTSWVAIVPDQTDPIQPAWPQTLEYLRRHQLGDGGWGDLQIYYAHERTLSTLAAIRALAHWKSTPEDELRIEDGLRALHSYALAMLKETFAPGCFTLLLTLLCDDLRD